MKTQTIPTAPDQTETLLQGLITECHAVIRDVVLPGKPLHEATEYRFRIWK